MLIAADTHVHLYPGQDPGTAFRLGLEQLGRYARQVDARVLCLTERADCHAFRDLASGALRAAGCRIEPGPEPGCLRVADEKGAALWLIAGRQMSTAERLEWLSLGTDAEVPDGLSLDDTLGRIRAAGGLPVLTWAVGKWFGARGKRVAKLLQEQRPGSFLVGDTSLRPTWWPTPDLMSYASLKGFKVIAGSDPLPPPGEERHVARYGVVLDGPWDDARPVTSLRALLTDPAVAVMTRGVRSPPGEVWQRLRAHKRLGRTA